MEREIDYLLKYISNESYKKILLNNEYIINDLIDNRVDVLLNIRYLIKLGVKNIDNVVLNRLDDILLSNNKFIKVMTKYEEKLGKLELISMLENS